jgi:N-acetyl-gamma-glutamyl-phosphate reductase
MKVGIVGASGYTGHELMRVLTRHPKIEIVYATSERYAGSAIAEIFPSFKGVIDLQFSELSLKHLIKAVDFVFTALPHGQSMAVVSKCVEAGKRIVDLSADFRFKDPNLYERWYGKHSCPDLLQEAVYGLPELYRAKIKKARLVANPGCYPTGAILALVPLLEEGLIETSGIVVDAKSGVSGAGRGLFVANLFCEDAEGLKAYSVAKHRHAPEMEQELGFQAKGPVALVFVPHLIPINRGILSTIYTRPAKAISTGEAYSVYERRYANEPFVRICSAGTFPSTMEVRGSNYCDLGLVVDNRSGQLIVISALDNLVKGASGQAVQNMNVMCGFSEGMGLQLNPLFP